jgi:hypothetical protein
MFGIFRTRRRERQTPSSINPTWHKLEQSVEKKQRRWSAYLGQKVKSWPLLQVRIAFGSLGLLYGGLCVYLIAGGFQQSTEMMRVDGISIPTHVMQPDTLLQQSPFISDSTHLRIKMFRAYMDSLRYDREGRAVYDSIVKARPGLMDSVTAIESIYKQQKK